MFQINYFIRTTSSDLEPKNRMMNFFCKRAQAIAKYHQSLLQTMRDLNYLAIQILTKIK